MANGSSRVVLLLSMVVALALAAAAQSASKGVPNLLRPNGGLSDGRGARVIAFNVRQSKPLVLALAAGSAGGGNVVVVLTGPGGRRLLVNTLGSYSGTTLYPYAPAGRYRLSIQATGVWTAAMVPLTPSMTGDNLVSRFTGSLDEAWVVHVNQAVEPTIDARCSCESNFIVWLRDFRGGGHLLVNEIGNYRGQTLGRPIPRGSYVVEVQASGPWSIKISS